MYEFRVKISVFSVIVPAVVLGFRPCFKDNQK